MILTKKLLIQWGACKEGIAFCERNKLFGFDLDRIDEIKGDHNDFINWLKRQLNIKRGYDSNTIKCCLLNGCWYILTFDDNDNKIKEEKSNGNWTKWEYDTNGNKIKYEDSSGYWMKWEYDKNGNKIKEESDGYREITETEIYPNGQLKRIGELELPLI